MSHPRQLLLAAHREYYEQVAKRRMRYGVFVQQFIDGHRHTDATSAGDKNRHQQAIGLLEGLLTRHKALAESFFNTDSPTEEEAKALIDLYCFECATAKGAAHSAAPVPRCGCDAEDVALLAAVANSMHVFSGDITADAMYDLLDGRLQMPLTVIRTSVLASLLNILSNHSLIQGRWQEMLGNGGMLLSRNGEQLKPHALSSALCRATNSNNPASGLDDCITHFRTKYGESRHLKA